MIDFPPILTAAEMRASDAAATGGLGLPSLLLMENAGRGVAELVHRELGLPRTGSPSVTIVCGGGSNGGDGFVAARHLARAGVSTRVLLTAARARIKGDAAVALGALERLGVAAIEDGSGWTDVARWAEALTGSAAVVDAILGIGARGPIAGVPAAALAAMNAAAGRKIAVDLPSGLDADTGLPTGIVFVADLTATMGAWKVGLAIDAAAPVGRVEVVDLGVPIATEGARCRLIDRAGVAARLPRRSPDANKGSSGHLLVVAGAAGKTGAAVLVGQAALRAGAGLVTIASTAAGQTALDAKVVELMTARYAEGDDAEPGALASLVAGFGARVQALAVGPGIPTGSGMRSAVRELAAELALPMVLDADALNALGTDAASILARARAPRVLTPHPGEMARLVGLSVADVQADRLGHARKLAAAARAVVVLKGARTVVAAPDGWAFVSPIACSALATAGSGDVLCGVIGALVARRLDPLTAAIVGVHVHGAAGQTLGKRLGDGMTSGDLPIEIARVMAELAVRAELAT